MISLSNAEYKALVKDASLKHDYEEAAEFYAGCGCSPDSLKEWIVDLKGLVKMAQAVNSRDKKIVEQALQEVGQLKLERIHWKESRQSAIYAGELMKAERDALQAEVTRLERERGELRDELTRLQDELYILYDTGAKEKP